MGIRFILKSRGELNKFLNPMFRVLLKVAKIRKMNDLNLHLSKEIPGNHAESTFLYCQLIIT